MWLFEEETWRFSLELGNIDRLEAPKQTWNMFMTAIHFWDILPTMPRLERKSTFYFR